jgi:hypothetical protein
MNMVEEWVVTLGFKQGNPKNSPTPSIQKSQGQPTKVGPPKAKEANLDSNGGSKFYSTKEGGKDKCWMCGGLHKKKDRPNPPQTITWLEEKDQYMTNTFTTTYDYLVFTIKLFIFYDYYDIVLTST